MPDFVARMIDRAAGRAPTMRSAVAPRWTPPGSAPDALVVEGAGHAGAQVASSGVEPRAALAGSAPVTARAAPAEVTVHVEAAGAAIPPIALSTTPIAGSPIAPSASPERSVSSVSSSASSASSAITPGSITSSERSAPSRLPSSIASPLMPEASARARAQLIAASRSDLPSDVAEGAPSVDTQPPARPAAASLGETLAHHTIVSPPDARAHPAASPEAPRRVALETARPPIAWSEPAPELTVDEAPRPARASRHAAPKLDLRDALAAVSRALAQPARPQPAPPPSADEIHVTIGHVDVRAATPPAPAAPARREPQVTLAQYLRRAPGGPR